MADINSPEHRAQLAARKAQGAHGPHIRETVSAPPPPIYDVSPPDPEVDVKAMSLQMDALTDMLSKLIVGVNGAKPAEDADVQLPKPRFDGTVSWGNILVLLGFAVSAALGYANQQQTNAHFEDALKQNAVEIAKVRSEGEARAAHYAPIIEEARQQNQAQNTRQDNFVDSLKSLRDMLTEVVKTMSEQARANAEMHEAITVLRMQLERLNPPGPRGG